MSKEALTIYSQLEHLLGLRPPSQVSVLSPSQKLDAQSDWIIGFKVFSDEASLHGAHWERHPLGDEVLCLLEGQVRVILRGEDTSVSATVQVLEPGQMIVVPRGGWHRLEAVQPGRLLFITPARGSEHEKVVQS